MIPILYDNESMYDISKEYIDPSGDDVDQSDIIDDVVQPSFKTGGKGRLDECINCTVDITGDTYDLQFEYPVNGRMYSKIINGSVVVCDADAQRKPQPFVVYRRELNLGNTVTFYAHHISYVLCNQILPPARYPSFLDLRAAIVDDVVRGTPEKADIYAIHFACQLDGLDVLPSGVDSVTINRPASVREVLGEFITATGCEVEYDRFGIIIHAVRGKDNNVTVAYGDNLIDARQDNDTDQTYNGVVPYWINPDTGAPFPASDSMIYVEKSISYTRYGYYRRLRPLDMSGAFDSQPTENELREAASEYLNANEPWNPSDTLTVSFVPDDGNEERIAALQTVRLYDTVRVLIRPMGTNVTRRVVRTTYNVLLDRYDSVEIGQLNVTLSDIYGGGSGGGFYGGAGGGPKRTSELINDSGFVKARMISYNFTSVSVAAGASKDVTTTTMGSDNVAAYCPVYAGNPLMIITNIWRNSSGYVCATVFNPGSVARNTARVVVTELYK